MRVIWTTTPPDEADKLLRGEPQTEAEKHRRLIPCNGTLSLSPSPSLLTPAPLNRPSQARESEKSAYYQSVSSIKRNYFPIYQDNLTTALFSHNSPLILVYFSSFLQDDSENNPSTPGSPTSAGFSTDRLPPSHPTDSNSDDEAAEDPHILDDVLDDMAAGTPADIEEEEGEDLYNDNYLE